MKCLPLSQIHLAKGNVLHDWHAEILALRAFNAFLIRECADLALTGSRASSFVRRREDSEITASSYQPFTIREDVKIHMYCSEAPCGDASMELTMAAQVDAVPWPLPEKHENPADDPQPEGRRLHGRGYFSELGIVRRKPARPDAPQTLSKSCSDKLAQKQCTSLLSSLTAILIQPSNAYLSRLVLPESQHIPAATTRAFTPDGRMGRVVHEDGGPKARGGGYAFRPFQIRTTDLEFEFSRRSLKPEKTTIPSNLTAVYTPKFQETLINGVLQGRKQFDPRGASRLARRSMWGAVLDVVRLLSLPALVQAVEKRRYAEVKEDDLLRERNAVKQQVRRRALEGWVRNQVDDFSLALDRGQ